MSGSNNIGISSILISGWTTMLTTLQNIQLALSNIATSLAAVVFGLSANNTFTGDNTFTGTTTFSGPAAFTGGASFKPPPTISEGAIGTGTFLPAGYPSNQTSVAGVGNGADITDDLLFSYTLPADSFDQTGRGVTAEAYGKFAANGNDKRVKLFVNAVLWYDSGVTVLNNTSWYSRIAFTFSAATTVTGYAIGFSGTGVLGAVGVGSNAGVPTAAPIVITVTGASPTTGAASDVVGHGFSVEFMN